MYEHLTTEELEAKVAALEERKKRRKLITMLEDEEEEIISQPSPIDLSAEIEKCHSEQKKFKQPNILQAFGLSASFTNKKGVTKVLSPGIVEDIDCIQQLQCCKCHRKFTNRGNLARHEGGECHTLLTPVSEVAKPGRSNNRGSATRQGYTHQQKMMAVLFYNSLEPHTEGAAAEFCRQTSWPLSTVQKWLKDPDSRRSITQAWAHAALGKRTGQMARGLVAKGKFEAAEKRLFTAITARRARGRRVSPLYVSRTMMQMIREIYLADDYTGPLQDEARAFRATPSWRCRFYARHKLTIRRRTNKKSLPLVERIEKWKKYHAALRTFLRTNMIDRKYGRFMPQDRYNVDQVI